MKESIVYIGIDVAKAHLDVAWQKHSRRFANSKSGRGALVKWIKAKPAPVQIICEASGGYRASLARGAVAKAAQSQFGAG
jgi:transposase